MDESNRNYVPGRFYRICDRTGFKVPASETVQQWNGLVVRKQSAEPRHPQQFVRGRADKQSVPLPRPRSIEEFVGTLNTTVTARAAAGATILDVDSSVRFAINDRLLVMLDNGEAFRTTVLGVPSMTQIELAGPLPWSTSPGNVITDLSAVAQAEIG